MTENDLIFDCSRAGQLFSGYLDGDISGREMHAMAAHLEGCARCGTEFATWRGMQRTLAAAGPVKPPEDLGLRLRLAISKESARRRGHWWDPISVRWTNLVRPMVLQLSAGLAGALLLIGSIGGLVGVVAAPPQSVQANDEPLGALTAPHYLYSMVSSQPVVTGEDATLVIQADINEKGQVYDYHIVSGPSDVATLAQIRDQLLVQVYEPAEAFGLPVRGQVLITFSGVSVRA